MEEYILVADAMAEPMTRGQYNSLRGWVLPENENSNDKGYFVTLLISNESEHITWYPETVFKKLFCKAR